MTRLPWSCSRTALGLIPGLLLRKCWAFIFPVTRRNRRLKQRLESRHTGTRPHQPDELILSLRERNRPPTSPSTSTATCEQTLVVNGLAFAATARTSANVRPPAKAARG